MEESMISTNHMCSSEEESSWALYLDDFMSPYLCVREDDSLVLSKFGTSSFPSESSPYSSLKNHRLHSNNDSEVQTGRMSAKKRKIRPTFVDHDLEDDACSPDNTPKAKDFSQLLMDTKEMIGSDNIFHEHNLSQKFKKQQADGITNDTYQGEGNISDQNTESYCTGLRKKGLCLVPFSILFNCVS